MHGGLSRQTSHRSLASIMSFLLLSSFLFFSRSVAQSRMWLILLESLRRGASLFEVYTRWPVVFGLVFSRCTAVYPGKRRIALLRVSCLAFRYHHSCFSACPLLCLDCAGGRLKFRYVALYCAWFILDQNPNYGYSHYEISKGKMAACLKSQQVFSLAFPLLDFLL